MPVPHSISADKLARLIGTPAAPVIVDLRRDAAHLIPGAIRRVSQDVRSSAEALAGRAVVVVDAGGGSDAAAVAGLLRSMGAMAEILSGGMVAWIEGGHPTLALAHLPPRHDDGRTWWVTRIRPKVDRIACPWLIRRFVDPDARFLFVAPGDVLAVAAQLGAEPFDVDGDGVFWSHRGERCTFDTMLDVFGLAGHAPLARLATIVRGADTNRLDLVPEAAGLLAVSLGLSRVHGDDLEQLDAGMPIYDAFYRWCRDAQDERHDWTSHQPTRKGAAA
jgi:rhodanese-related sulfurtransferase